MVQSRDCRHITKVFFYALQRKSDSFPKQQSERIALISCIAMWQCILFAHSHTIQVWGYCIVYCCLGFVRTFFEIDENNLTLSFYNNRTFEVDGQITIRFMRKIFLLGFCFLCCGTAFAQKKQLASVKIDTIYYDKEWKAAQSPLFADFYRLAMYDSKNPQAGYKIRDYFITGELQGEGMCTHLGTNNDNETKWEGKVITYFKNGKLSSEATYKNGLLEGESIRYYENGLIETKIPFKNNKIDGTALIFTDNGAKCKRIEYVNGELKYDYYEVIDHNGNYSKFYHKDDKVKWTSPPIEDKQIAYSNGKKIYYYENNGLTISVHMAPSNDYGKYLKFNVVVANNSCEAVDVKMSNISVQFQYPDGIKTKENPRKLHLIPYYEYEAKIKRKQNATKALTALANGLAAANAGYSASSTNINSGYAGVAAAASGNATGVGAYAGVSSSNINTVSYDGFAAYQASMIANAQYNAMSREMLEERANKIDAYLKDNTVFPGNVIDGYFLITIKIPKAYNTGGVLCVNFYVGKALHSFPFRFPSNADLKAKGRELNNQFFTGKMSYKEMCNQVTELWLNRFDAD